MNSKTAAITFGRMNPPTIGHQKLVDKLQTVARINNADPMVFLSHSADAKKNPLPYNSKVSYAISAFGNIVRRSPAKTIFEVMQQLHNLNYNNVIVVVGADRVNEFDVLLNKYNNSELYSFDSIKLVSAGERDPDSDSVEGMSASKMRELVKQRDLERFLAGAPTKMSRNAKIAMYNELTTQMGLKENVINFEDDLTDDDLMAFINSNEFEELDESVELLSERKALTIAQRIKRGRQMRKLQPKLKARRKLRRKMMATPERLVQRARKAAIMLLRKKLAGKKGSNYASLSPSEKQNVDRLIEKSYGAVDRIAKRLLPIIKRKEMQRLRDERKAPVNEQQDLANKHKKQQVDLKLQQMREKLRKKSAELRSNAANVNEITELEGWGQNADFRNAVGRIFNKSKHIKHVATLSGGHDLLIDMREIRSENGMHAYIMSDDVKQSMPIGVITLYPFSKRAKTFQTKYTISVPEARGKNLFVQAYAALVKKMGFNLLSDSTQTTGSMKLWQQLAREPGVYVYGVKPAGKIRYFSKDATDFEYTDVKIDDVKLQGTKFAVYPSLPKERFQEINDESETLWQKISILKNLINGRHMSFDRLPELRKFGEKYQNADNEKRLRVLKVLEDTYKALEDELTSKMFTHDVLLMAVKGRRAKI